MEYLTIEDILSIRDQISADYGDRFEVMSMNGLLSALAAPRRSAFGAEAFPSLPEKAGALAFSLIQNHPFWDGNKRIATAALRQFLGRNGAALVASDAEVKAFTTTIARGVLRDGAIAAWIGSHIE